MIPILFAFALLAQGAPALQSDNGKIAGTLKTSTGVPAIGVRVAAMAVPASLLDAISSGALVSLAETDINGHYRLENIPPGRYYITAGRVDVPTYFPGTPDMSGGAIISITSKAAITGIDFTIQNTSISYAGTSSANIQAGLRLAVQVSMENGARQPVSADGYYVTLGLTRTADGARTDVLLSSNLLAASLPALMFGAEYRVTVDNLPDGYVVKSLKYGSADLLTNTLKLNSTNVTPTPTLQFSLNNSTSATSTTGLMPSSSPLTGTANSTISITLGTAPPAAPPSTGIRVTGNAPVRGTWTVYRGDIPGTFYADGSYELRGVPPGRHLIVLQDESSVPNTYAAIITATDRDLAGVALDKTVLFPKSIVLPPASTANAQGSVHSLAGIYGRVLEEDNGQPIGKGVVTIMGRTMLTLTINDGKFELPHLLPGSYDLRMESFEHFTLYETVVVSDEDVRREFRLLSNQVTAADLTSEPDSTR